MIRCKIEMEQYLTALINLIADLNSYLQECMENESSKKQSLREMQKITNRIDKTIDLVYSFANTGYECCFDKDINASLCSVLKIKKEGEERYKEILEKYKGV